MNTLLGGGFMAGGTWAAVPALGAFNPATGVLTTGGLAAGVYNFTYTVFGAAPCPNDVANFTVTINNMPNAGTDNTVTLCNNAGSTFNMNGLLGGGAMAGGTWAAVPALGAFNPATGVLTSGGLAAGSYNFTYTVFGVAPCPNDVANFTVTVNNMPNAGTDNNVTLCNNAGSTFNMNTLLGGGFMAGGTWAAVPALGAFNPATGVLTSGGLAAGVYNFTYTVFGAAPCPNDVANFTVTINNMPVAGPDGGTVLCNSAGSTVDLDGILIGAMGGGTWVETTIPASGQFTPATGVFNAAGLGAGVYTFTYTLTGVAPCPNDAATITVTISDLPVAGLDGNTQICNTAGSTVNLNTLLSGADPGGTWAETSASGSFTPATGILNTAGLAAGAYTFTYTLAPVGPCPGDVANFTVTVQDEVNAGANGATQICNTAGSSTDLDALLSGADAGGTWAAVPVIGAFNPATAVFTTGGLAAGVYNFTYTVFGVAPCPNDVANFTVTVQQEVFAGANGATQICNTAGSSTDLDLLLAGADPGGTWAETTSSGSFTPGTGVLNTAGLAAGVYSFTYTVFGVAPCPNDVANFTVTVQDEVNAGLDNNTQICNTAGSSVNLNTLLSGADAGGTWVETSASGAFTPATGVLNTAGLTAGAYTFTYTVTGIAPCPNDVANFTVTVQQEAIAGADNSAQSCNSAGSTVNLNTLLVGAAAGTWAETTASGAFNAATGVLTTGGLAAGVYSFTYTVFGVAPCPNDVANFTVTVFDLPTAGLDNNTQICNLTGSTVNLNTLLSGADAGGTWAETSGSGAFTPATGILNTAGLGAGAYTFTYTVPPVGVCPGDVANFTVTVEQEVFAGTDNVTQICNTVGSTVNLNTLLSGADAGGVFAETSASASFTPATGVLATAGLGAGVYSFTYTVTGVAPCPNDVSNFNVTVQQEVFAGLDGATQQCNYPGSVVNLNTLLSGADAGGAFAETSASGSFTPATGTLNTAGLSGGVYSFTYTVTGVAPCPNDVSNFTVTVDQVPTVTPVIDHQLCDADNHVIPVFTSDVAGTVFNWNNTTGTDVGFGLAGAGIIGAFTGAGSSSDVIVTIQVVPTSPAGCVGVPVTFDVTVHPLPAVSFFPDTLIGCEPLQVTFTNTSTHCDNGVWDFGNGTTAMGCGIVSTVFESAGLYDITLTVTSMYGCTSTLTVADLIDVRKRPEAVFSYSPNGMITIDNTMVEFTNHSTDADGYLWDFGDGSANTSATDPTHNYPEEGDKDYTVTLTAQSAAGCPDVTTALIHIDNIIIFWIPNTFTPDGNGYNDLFQPVITAGVDIYDFHFAIFNRWGEIIFESFNPAGGWDGTYGDRGLVQEDVYVWSLEFGETMSDKKHKHRGHVTILK